MQYMYQDIDLYAFIKKLIDRSQSVIYNLPLNYRSSEFLRILYFKAFWAMVK